MLTIVSTPIGHLEDITVRAKQVLEKADLILAEDTRVTGKLFQLLGITKKGTFWSYHDANEKSVALKVVSAIQSGRYQNVVLVSDAGTPLISDPGYCVVNACWEAGIPVTVCPGPCALIGALTVSGFPAHQFVFRGFPPSKAGKRRIFFKENNSIPWTTIFYESTKRLLVTLKEIHEILGDREIAIIFELTKIHERVIRGRVSRLLDNLKEEILKGECVLIIKGND